jgi:hypothetical protein
VTRDSTTFSTDWGNEGVATVHMFVDHDLPTYSPREQHIHSVLGRTHNLDSLRWGLPQTVGYPHRIRLERERGELMVELRKREPRVRKTKGDRGGNERRTSCTPSKPRRPVARIP